MCVCVCVSVSVCVCVCACVLMCVLGGYVFTCLTLLAHDLAGSLVRQRQSHMYSIFNLYVLLNRDTCLLMRRRVSQ